MAGREKKTHYSGVLSYYTLTVLHYQALEGIVYVFWLKVLVKHMFQYQSMWAKCGQLLHLCGLRALQKCIIFLKQSCATLKSVLTLNYISHNAWWLFYLWNNDIPQLGGDAHVSKVAGSSFTVFWLAYFAVAVLLVVNLNGNTLPSGNSLLESGQVQNSRQQLLNTTYWWIKLYYFYLTVLFISVIHTDGTFQCFSL